MSASVLRCHYHNASALHSFICHRLYNLFNWHHGSITLLKNFTIFYLFQSTCINIIYCWRAIDICIVWKYFWVHFVRHNSIILAVCSNVFVLSMPLFIIRLYKLKWMVLCVEKIMFPSYLTVLWCIAPHYYLTNNKVTAPAKCWNYVWRWRKSWAFPSQLSIGLVLSLWHRWHSKLWYI